MLVYLMWLFVVALITGWTVFSHPWESLALCCPVKWQLSFHWMHVSLQEVSQQNNCAS